MFKCPETSCPKSYKTRDGLKNHRWYHVPNIEVHYGNGERETVTRSADGKFHCPQCDHVDKNAEAYRRHISKHPNTRQQSNGIDDEPDMPDLSRLNEDLARYNLWISPALRAMVCLECKYYVQSPLGHLKGQHGYPMATLTRTNIKSLLDRVERDATLRTQEQLFVLQGELRAGGVAVQAYENIAHLEGYKCNDCGHVVGAESTLKRHRTIYCKGAASTRVFAQSFFKSRGRAFFEVLLPKDDDDEISEDEMDEVNLLVEACNIRTDGEEELGPDLWMQRTLWHQYAGGDTTHLDSLKEMMMDDSRHRPSPKLARIASAVEKMLYDGLALIPETTVIYLRLLKSPRASETVSKPLSQKQNKKTYTDYFAQWRTMVIYLFRIFEDDGMRDVAGMKIGNRLTELMGTLNTMAEAEDADLQSAVLEFSLELLASPIGVSDRFQDPVINAMAVRGWNSKDSRWSPPDRYTKHVAAVLYCARVIVLRKAWWDRTQFLKVDADDREQADGVFSTTLYKWRKYLLEDSKGPIGELMSQLALGKVLAENSWLPGKLWWNHDQSGLSYDGEYFGIREFRGFVKHLISEAEDTMKELFLLDQSDALPSIDLQNLRDIPSRLTANYSFHSQPENQEFVKRARTHILHKLLRTGKLRSEFFTDNRRRRLAASRVLKYNRTVSRFLDLLAVLTLVTSGQPFRGTELTRLMVHNTKFSVRNVFLMNGEVMILTSYNKTQALTGHIKCVARFLTPRLSALYLMYSCYVAPFACYIQKRSNVGCFAPSVFLFQNLGGGSKSYMDTEQISTVLASEATRTMKFNLHISKYRQIAAGMSRLFVEEMGRLIDKQVEEVENAYSASRGHSVRMATKTYGLSAEALGIADETLMVAYRRAAIYWQHFIGAIDELPAWILRPNAVLRSATWGEMPALAAEPRTFRCTCKCNCSAPPVLEQSQPPTPPQTISPDTTSPHNELSPSPPSLALTSNFYIPILTRQSS